MERDVPARFLLRRTGKRARRSRSTFLRFLRSFAANEFPNLGKLRVVVLNRADFPVFTVDRFDGTERGAGAGLGGDDRNIPQDAFGTDFDFVHA